MRKQVSVIGGGLGGLSAAIRLAASGFQVSLYEQNPQLGGKMNELTCQGFRFDTGPSLLTMPFVIDELFRKVGLDRRDYLNFMPIAPICRYFWEDGQILDASGDPEKMQAEIARFSEADARQYPAFLEYSKTIYDLTADIFLNNPIHELSVVADRQNLKTLRQIHRIDPFRTVHNGIRRFFKHPRIVQVFDRYATYNGSNPYKAPATLNIIPHVEYQLGSYYIDGGMYELVRALEKLAEMFNVEVYTGTTVEKILHRNGQVSGLIANEKTISADYVVCNADVVAANTDLIDGFPKTRRRLNRLEPSLSGVVFLWGIRSSQEQLAHHNIFFSENYLQEFQQIFDDQMIPPDPTVYVAVTSKANPEHAPAGMENWFVLINAPYTNSRQDWLKEMDMARKHIQAKLKSCGLDIADDIVCERAYSPADFQRLYGSNRGSIYGISSNSKMTAFRRPANRSRDIDGLYYVGGSTHPGGGIPLVLLSGKISADMIEKREKTSHTLQAAY